MLEYQNVSWKEIVSKHSVKRVLDIGAFLGTWADGMSQLIDGDEILSIEANPHCEASLCKKGRRYRICCLSNEDKTVDFHVNPHNLVSSGESYYRENTPHFENSDVIKMQAKTLDQVVGNEKFDLIRIHVQGCELDVINGGKNVLEKTSVVIVATSTSDFEYNIGAPKQNHVIDRMSQLGFKAVCSIENHQYDGKTIKQCVLFEKTSSKEPNVLFINHFGHVDFLNDHVYEGFVRQPGFKVWETHNPFYMLKGCSDLNGMWGRGIGYGKMTHVPNVEDPATIKEKILNKFYDLVVYGSIRRCRDHFEDVTRSYPVNKVLIFDGEDDQGVDTSLTQYGIYFKRELVSQYPGVLPISFAATESAMATKFLEKRQVFGTCIPGDPSTYRWDFHTQREYYKDYNRSFYGVTHAKAGWDCNRHYEILASHCVPYFPGLENCPPLTMTNFPKSQILNANKWSSKNIVPSNYEEILDELFEYTKDNLITEKMVAKMVLSKI